MKQLFLFVFSLFSGMSYAASIANLNHYDTYMGVNFKQNWITPRGDWNKLFVKEEPGFNVYAGWRFHPNFGVEFGYEWTDNKPKVFVVQPGTTLLGVANTTGSPVTLTGKVRFKAGALDLNAFIPLCSTPLWEEVIPEGIISLGVAATKASMKISSNGSTAPATTFSNQFTQIQGRTKAVYRAGFGIQALVIENFGIRALWRYENTSVLRGRNSAITSNANTRTIFKNGNSMAVGLFFKF